MSQASAKRAEPVPENPVEQKESFSNKPTVLADNGHGTRVKLWTNKTEAGGEFQTVSIERSYKPKGSEEYKTDKVSLNADDLLAVARGLERGHDQIIDKQIGKQGQART